ncbi:FadD32-like long-chain-fatty-acid--AMP ligase [Corynebacterium appendicis]|uniref:FadD32-like long-chain-fatty-acid--AMP ligase n=1 Tax=Corynebacterium appendicis TaxID=163202 RepID=UPI00254D4075|nr:FadD32-like long-chain-fatty-acid--AMP ligase [Corynebacterium appendicis]MDK8626420.1 FadD32-like long-chain-fatty-acid--AMP ligase [Corynebacterium appendicis]
MDLEQLLYQFYDDDKIDLPPELSLFQLCEMLYQGSSEMGTGEVHQMRYWDFSDDRDGVAVDFTRDEVITRIKAVAARLQQTGTPGDRVAIMAANSPEYIFSFMGAIYAGQVPVPLYDPNEPGHGEQLTAVLSDSKAAAVLTNNAGAKAVRAFFAEVPRAERPRILVVDALPDSLAESWTAPDEPADGDAVDEVAFLQYTSGSTRLPAGVVLTHRAILTNVLQIYDAVELKMPLRLSTWLPLHHDMGIILTVFVTIMGIEFELMGPRDFIQQPKRWVDQITKREQDEKDETFVYTVVPNFALDLAARYAAPENPEDYDFSALDGIIVGSEPVTKAAVETFVDAFGPSTLDPQVIRPSYGLAEATLIVSTPQTDERPLFKNFDREEVGRGRIVEAEDGIPFASNGQPVPDMRYAIVDPETHEEVEEGAIGELWLHGDNVAAGYEGREDDTKQTFGNTLRGQDGWLATGDLVAFYQGHLYITGRLKDLVVIAGRNHYPQDIEATVMEASDHVRPDSVAAFAVPGEDVEKLVLLVERVEGADEASDALAEDAIRGAVSNKHGISPEVVRFYAPNEIARSSSGKIARVVNRAKFLQEN